MTYAAAKRMYRIYKKEKGPLSFENWLWLKGQFWNPDDLCPKLQILVSRNKLMLGR